jgi:superfamily II DNA/RNA helicase
VTAVLNFGLSWDREAYLHRIGRPSRLGKGCGADICNDPEVHQAKDPTRHRATAIAELPDNMGKKSKRKTKSAQTSEDPVI